MVSWIKVVQPTVVTSLVVGTPAAIGLGPGGPAVASIGQWRLELGMVEPLGFVRYIRSSSSSAV